MPLVNGAIPLRWPAFLMRENSLVWQIRHRTIDPGPSMALLSRPVNATGGGLWACKLNSVIITEAVHEMAWDAIDALMDGGTTPVVLPRCCSRTAPWPVINGVVTRRAAALPYSDGSYFSDGSGYDGGPVIIVRAAAAGLRTVTLRVAVDQGSALQPGMHFSIDHATKGWRLYRIAAVSVVSQGDNAGVYDIEIRTPLREAIGDDTPMEFDRPRCFMRLVTPDDMGLDLVLRRTATPSISFLEALF